MNINFKNYYLSEQANSNQNYSQSNQLYPLNAQNFELNLNLKNSFHEKNESEIFGEKYLYFIDASTLSKTDNNKKEKKFEKKIFNITKDKIKLLHRKRPRTLFNKRGRLKKAKNKNEQNKGKKFHSKSELDNITNKIKVFFIQSSMQLINNRYKNYAIKKGKKGKKIKFLWKIKTNFTQTIKKEINLKFLKMKIKDLFSSDLSDKCTKLNKEYNKQKIKELYQKNEAKEVIEILDKTVEELLQSYINGDYENEGFYIENDLEKEKEKMINNGEDNIDDYAKKFLETANNFGNIFRKKIPRQKKNNETC